MKKHRCWFFSCYLKYCFFDSRKTDLLLSSILPPRFQILFPLGSGSTLLLIITSIACLFPFNSTASTAAAAAAKSLQSCPTLCDPIDGRLPGSPVPGILQARTLEWVAISFSNAWKWKVKGKSLSRVQLFATPWTAAYQAPLSMGFSRQEYWSGVPLPSPIYSAYKLNKQSDSIQPWHTPFPIWNQSVVPCPVLTVASWLANRFAGGR